MVNLMLQASWAASNGLWGRLLGWFYSGIGDFGWTIVIFTICLKLVLVPLDIYQRHISNKTTEKQNEMKPELDKAQKLYGNKPELLNQKTMEIYRKHNFNLGSSCLGLLINMLITMVVFFTLFSALRSISNTLITDEYTTFRTTYVSTYQSVYQGYIDEYDSTLTEFTTPDEYADSKATEDAQIAVYNKYNEIKQGWLWIKNIYLTDTATSPFPDFKTYVQNSRVTYKDGYTTLSDEIAGVTTEFESADKSKELAQTDYNKICAYAIEKTKGQWNGYYILIVLAGLITYLSTKVSRIGQPKQTQKVQRPDGTFEEKEINPMGTMSIFLPLLMVFFTWSYTGLFAIYVVTNSIISVIISLIIIFVKKYFKTGTKKKTEPEISYSRYNN